MQYKKMGIYFQSSLLIRNNNKNKLYNIKKSLKIPLNTIVEKPKLYYTA